MVDRAGLVFQWHVELGRGAKGVADQRVEVEAFKCLDQEVVEEIKMTFNEAKLTLQQTQLQQQAHFQHQEEDL